MSTTSPSIIMARSTTQLPLTEIENLVISVAALENDVVLEDEELIGIFEIFKTFRKDNPFFEKLVQEQIQNASGSDFLLKLSSICIPMLIVFHL